MTKLTPISKTWNHVRKLYLCKCGWCFNSHDDFAYHLKTTKRWRKYHYAPDYNEIPCVIWERRKR